jgi:multimeric flavodoxin WrbA
MEKFKVLGISGSPRKGNTDALVKKALEVCSEGGLEIDFVSLSDFNVIYCDDCNFCRKNYGCSKQDEVQKILEKMDAADALIIGSPTYFGSVSGKLKSLFDRTLPMRRHGFKLSGKVGGAIAVGGSRNGGQEFVIQTIHHWMLIHGMVVVSDRKTSHFGGISVARNPEDALNDHEGMETVKNLSENIVKTLLKK